MERKTKDEKNLNKIKKLDKKNNRKYSSRSSMKKRIKNSKVITNVKEIGEDGLIYLKSGEVATLIEVKAIDLSLTSNQEKNLFFCGNTGLGKTYMSNAIANEILKKEKQYYIKQHQYYLKQQ